MASMDGWMMESDTDWRWRGIQSLEERIEPRIGKAPLCLMGRFWIFEGGEMGAEVFYRRNVRLVVNIG